jgi:hypothetical protein
MRRISPPHRTHFMATSVCPEIFMILIREAARRFLSRVSDPGSVPYDPGTYASTRCCTRMARARASWKSQSPEFGASMLSVFGVLFVGAAVLFVFLYDLLQPPTIPHPGLAAFSPPAGTRLIPLPRVSNAPLLEQGLAPAPLPSQPSSALSARAQADARQSTNLALPARQRPRTNQTTRQPDAASRSDFGNRGGPKAAF